MIPVEFRGANCVLHGKNCDSLPCFRDGRCVVSCWQLSDDELKAIQLTGQIYISVYSGQSSPPILPSITTPLVFS